MGMNTDDAVRFPRYVGEKTNTQNQMLSLRRMSWKQEREFEEDKIYVTLRSV